jgi:Inovirus Coat protein B
MNKFNSAVARLQASKRAKRILALAAVVGMASANAAGEGPDGTTLAAAIAATSAAVVLVGNADLVVRVGVKAFSYVRSALGR